PTAKVITAMITNPPIIFTNRFWSWKSLSICAAILSSDRRGHLCRMKSHLFDETFRVPDDKGSEVLEVRMKLVTIVEKLAIGLLLLVGVISPALRADELVRRLSEEEAKKAVTSKVNPEYPAMARQMRLGGKVQVDAYIDTDGKVEKVQVV